jgi:hypothetical protein
VNTLKSVIHYPDTNSVEVTWVNEEDIQVKCHSYADVQMDMFRADAAAMGTILAAYETLIAQVEAAIVPYVPPPPVVVTSVSMRQARLALLGAGMLDAANLAIAGMTGIEGEAARIEWEYAQDVERSSPLVMGMTSALGLTEEQLDQLFILASGL